ncbi:MAG: hypothetical protein ABI835_01620 [Chloroflexota bacterium]
MSRYARIIPLIVLLISVWVAAAQDTSLTPEVVLTPGINPQATAFPTLPALDTPTAAPQVEVATFTPPPPNQPTAQPTQSALGAEQIEALPILISARNDLELLATAAIGSAQRPVGWSGTIDVNDPQLPLWIRLDLETLAGAIMGVDSRPVGWFGVVASIPLAIARDIRHDIEILADVVIGTSGVRPAGWIGDDPIMRCNRATQSLYTLLHDRGIDIVIDFTQPDYCRAAEDGASRFVERQVLQPPMLSANAAAQQGRYPFIADNPFVVAFLDRVAREKIGVLPVGTGFQPVSRSYVEFSNMVLVRGDNFQVFVDYTTTPMRAEQFLALPDVGAGSGGGTDCNAEWCGRGLD